jgi:hypothetical protein
MNIRKLKPRGVGGLGFMSFVLAVSTAAGVIGIILQLVLYGAVTEPPSLGR